MNPKRTFVALALGLLSGAIACSSDTPIDIRHEPTATLLPDGDVLVAGGAQYETILWMNATNVLPSTERYDPETGTWTPSGSLKLGRYAHTATALPSGKVLVAGGYSKLTPTSTVLKTSTTELYAPESGTWSSTGPMALARTKHKATLLMDGRVLVTGGLNDLHVGSATTEVYDPAAGSWFALAPMNTPRSGHSAVVLRDGKVLVSGGMNDTSLYLPSAEVYDPVANTWTPTGEMGFSRGDHVSTLLPNGKVLVTGGAQPELYEPETGLWSSAGGSEAMYGHTATSLPDGRVLIAGGLGAPPRPDAVEVYDPATHSWSTSSPLPEPRSSHSAVALRDGRVLVVGGGALIEGSYTPLNTARIYDPDTDTWE